MSLKMQAALNQLNTRMGEWEKATIIPMDSAAVHNHISEMSARIEELEHRVQVLEAKRKPGRPRKDER